MKTLAGKVVLITDFDAEIGAEVADRLLQGGASIFVTGFRASEIISRRFAGRPGITDTGIETMTTERITELFSLIQQDHGKLDVIFANNAVNPELDADSIFQKQTIGFSFTLQKLHPLLRDGGAIVVCASFRPEQRRKSKLIIDTATAYIESVVQHWALVLKARRIRTNVVSLYQLNPDFDVANENLGLSSDNLARSLRTRPNTVMEVTSAMVELAAEDSSVNGAEVDVVNGKAQVHRLSPARESDILGSPAQIVNNIVFLASEVSQPLTGMQLFPEGEIRRLAL